MEYLNIHYPQLWDGVCSALSNIDANSVRTKMSKEKTMVGRALISPRELNSRIDSELSKVGWEKPDRVNYVYSEDAATNRRLLSVPYEEQKRIVSEENLKHVTGHTKADFRYDRVALEVQFGKYSFVQYDIFAKHAANYMADLIDVGIELVPMHSMYENMSSGPSYYERNLNEILRQGRIFPPVPLVLAGIAE